MNSKNVAIVLLTLTTLGGAALAWRQYTELTALRASGLGTAERASLQKKVWELQISNRNLQDQLAALRSGRTDAAAGALASEESGPADRGPGIGRNRGAQFAALREAMSKPEVQALIASARKSALDSQYAALFRRLNLTPEQADRLKSLLLERQNAFSDVMTAARDQGLDPRTDRDALRKLVADAQGTVSDSIKSLLGDNGYAEFTNYEQTLPQRTLVNALQQRLSTTDTPLTAAQSDQLVQILSANTPPRPTDGGVTSAPPDGGMGGPRGGDMGPGMGAVVGDFGGMAAIGPGSAPITPAALAAAQPVLSSSQFATLQQLQQQQQAVQEVQQAIRNSIEQGGTGGGSTGSGTGRRGGG